MAMTDGGHGGTEKRIHGCPGVLIIGHGERLMLTNGEGGVMKGGHFGTRTAALG